MNRIVLALCVVASSVVTAVGIARGESSDEVRTRLLGPGWDDPEAIRLRWVGGATFLASFGGHVVGLDGWVVEGLTDGYPAMTIEDFIAADPDFFYIGHGHFDHAGHVGLIAEATGAKVIGSSEHCSIAKAGARDADAVSCVPVLDRRTGLPFSGSESRTAAVLPARTPYGALGSPADGPPKLAVTVIMSKHSAARPPDPEDFRGPVAPPPDPTVVLDHPPTPETIAYFLRHAEDGEGGTLAYAFTLGEFTVLWHDSVGPLANPNEPGAAAIKTALASLRDVDIQLGAIGEHPMHRVTNGLKDARDYVQAATPKVFMPTHHDNWYPPLTSEGRAFYDPLVAELERIPLDRRPNLCFITDPENYETIFAFRASEWAGSSTAAISDCFQGT